MGYTPLNISVPGTLRSQTSDFLNTMINQNATDRRYEQQSLKDDRRFQLQLARQNRLDALAAARQSLADKRYNDSIAYRNQRDKKADANALALLEAQNESLLPTGIDLTETKDVEDRTKVLGQQLIDTYSEHVKEAPAVYSGYTEQPDGTFKNDINALTDEENKLLIDFNMIQNDEKLTSAEQKLAIMKKLIPASELEKDPGAIDKVKDHLKYALDMKRNFSPEGLVELGTEYAKKAKDYVFDSTLEKAEKEAKAARAAKKAKDAIGSDTAYKRLIKRVSKLSERKKKNEALRTKKKTTEEEFANWMRQYQKPKYGKKTIRTPVEREEALRRISKFIKKEEAQLSSKLDPLRRAQKINAIRKRAEATLSPYEKQRLKTIEKQEDLQDYVTKKQIDTSAGIKRDKAKEKAKELTKKKEYQAGSKERAAKIRSLLSSANKNDKQAEYYKRKKS